MASDELLSLILNSKGLTNYDSNSFPKELGFDILMDVISEDNFIFSSLKTGLITLLHSSMDISYIYSSANVSFSVIFLSRVGIIPSL